MIVLKPIEWQQHGGLGRLYGTCGPLAQVACCEFQLSGWKVSVRMCGVIREKTMLSSALLAQDAAQEMLTSLISELIA